MAAILTGMSRTFIIYHFYNFCFYIQIYSSDPQWAAVVNVGYGKMISLKEWKYQIILEINTYLQLFLSDNKFSIHVCLCFQCTALLCCFLIMSAKQWKRFSPHFHSLCVCRCVRESTNIYCCLMHEPPPRLHSSSGAYLTLPLCQADQSGDWREK